MAPARIQDVDSFLDNLPFNRFHLRALIISTIMMMVDGYDLALAGWVLPKLAADFGVARTALTPALMAQQIGMVIGAYLIAPIADRVGRRQVLLSSVAGIAVSCAATLLTHDIWTFAGCRLVTGIFASTIISNLVALSSDIAPARLRGTMSTIVLTGSMGGALLGALMQAFVLEQYGWQGAFIIAAALPAAMLPLVYFGLPESLRFLARRNPSDPRLAGLVRAMQGPNAEPIEVTFTARTRNSANRSDIVREILSPQRRVETAFLWLGFICSFTFISIYSGWATTMYHDLRGLAWKDIAVNTALYTGFGALGTLTVGIAVDRFGFRKVLPPAFLIAGLAVGAIGFTESTMQLYVAVAIMATFQVGGHSALATLAASLYDAGSRASGVGWAYGAGRVASIAGPAIGAFLLQERFAMSAIFALLAIPLITAAILVIALLGRSKRNA